MEMGAPCLDCIIAQMYKVLDLAAGAADRDRIAGELKSYISGLDISLAPPVFAKHAYRRAAELLGITDPFRDIKRAGNDAALALVPAAREIIASSRSPVHAALRICAAGNTIDHGVPGRSPDPSANWLQESLSVPIDEAALEQFSCDTERCGRILFIADNSGEIVFDRELIRVLRPGAVTCCVRGLPVQNDATRDDADQAGLSRIARVIDTGDGTPGIDLNVSSPDLLRELRAADMVLLKGQGNYETLFDADLSGHLRAGVPLYFLLKVKCGHVAQAIGRPVGDTVLLRRMSW